MSDPALIKLNSTINNELLKIKLPTEISNPIEPISSFHPNVLSLLVNLENDNRPYLNIFVLGWKLNGLLDTGASCSILGEGCVEMITKLGLTPSKIQKSVKTADGTFHDIVGFVYVPIEFNEHVKVLPVSLVPTLKKNLILGMDFFKLFNLEISFPTDSINVMEEVFVEPMLPEIPIDFCLLEEVKKEFPISVDGKLSCTHLLKYNIDTGSAKPIKQKHHYVSPAIQVLLNDELDRMIKLDVVEPSNSAWANPLVCVKKKNGKTRLCLDARALNSVSVVSAYPLPYISRILGRLNGTRYLSSIDLSDAFWQIPLDDSSKPKTAFVVPGRGLFQFKRMPFGLCSAAQNLSMLMDQVLGYDLEPKVFCYLDDVVIATNDYNEHIDMLREVASRLKRANLTINLAKSKFCVPKLAYLGYILDKDGIHVDSDKVKSITEYPVPKTLKEVRRFLGMCGWYRRFIPNFADQANHISNLLKKSKKFQWTAEADAAFLNLKTALISAPILISPDFTKPFHIQCDASNLAVGGVLFQVINGDEKVIAYTSQKLTATQQKYMACERELLAILHCVSQFRPYVEGTKFKVITDNAALLWLRNLKDPTGRLARWALKLQCYDYEIIHRPGRLNVVADALSRAIVEAVDVQNWYEALRNKIESKDFNPEQYSSHNGNIFKFLASQTDGSPWKLIVLPRKSRKFYSNVMMFQYLVISV